MTINIANNNPRINYTATANQTVFTVPFEFFDNTDIKVYIEGTLKTITTHYTVSGGNGSTGSVTLTAGATLNDEVTLVRDVPLERTTDLTSSYNAASIDAQLDRIVAEIADLDDRVSRTIQINDYELASGLLLPALDSRKGKTIQFNTSSGALEVGPTGADLTAIGSVTSEIATLAGISGNITTVAGSNAAITAVSNSITSVNAINTALTNVNRVGNAIVIVDLVGTSISDVNDVADSLGEISAVQAKLTNIDTVAIASTNIGTVAGSISQVNSVASKIADVTGVNNNISAITTANANSTNINLVANNIDDVNDVGTVITKVTTVADNIANVNLVAPNAQYLSDVANNITAINAIAPLASDLTNVTDNLTAIQNAGTNATNAASSATSAATSATAAQTAKTAAETALDEFTDIYLGSKSVAPTVDNDGNALATGSIYWNSGVDQLYIWDGSAWDDAAFTASGAVTSFNTRTGAVTLSSADITNAAGLLTTGGTMTGDLSFGDSDKAIFGAGSDLQIYHSGTQSIISDVGSGNLNLEGELKIVLRSAGGSENYAQFNKDGAVELYHNNNVKFATTSTGIDVTGTVTSGALTTDTISNASGNLNISSTQSIATTFDSNSDQTNREFNIMHDTNTRVFTANESGDISFYEDTGTTAKFFWDSSAESLGIGTTSPSEKLHVSSSGGQFLVNSNGHITSKQSLDVATAGGRFTGESSRGTLGNIMIEQTTTGVDGGYIRLSTCASGSTNPVERMRINSSGNVGIGESDPDSTLTVKGASHTNFQVKSNSESTKAFIQTVQDSDVRIGSSTNHPVTLYQNGTERMRIDSSGSVGIGTSSPQAELHVHDSAGHAKIRLSGAASDADTFEIYQGITGVTNGGLTIRDVEESADRLVINSTGNVGIGTSSPSADLEVVGGATIRGNGDTILLLNTASDAGDKSLIRFGDNNDADAGYIDYDHGTNSLAFGVNAAERMRIDSSGNVGIGTSPSANLHLKSTTSGDPELRIEGSGTNNGIITFLGGGHANPAVGIRYISSADSAGHLAFYANGSSSSTLSERMRIDSSGNVGIGTTSPDTELNIGFSGADDTNTIRVEGSNGASERYAFDIEADGENAKTNFKIGVGGGSTTTCMTLDSSGNLLVGKSSGGNEVQGTVLYNNGQIYATASGHQVMLLTRKTNNGEIILFYRDGTNVGNIYVTGSSTSYNTSSDYRLKENVVDLTGASARVNQLNPSRFNFIADADTTVDGFLAHEVADVVPEAITGTKDAMKDEEYEVTPATGDIYTPATEAYVNDDGNDVDAVDEVIHSADAEQPETLEDGQQWRETTAAVMGTRSVPDYQGIDQSKLVPLLTAALQEALTEIASLKTRVEALEG